MAHLHTIEPEDGADDLIEVLEFVLAEAREGKLSSVAVAKVYRDGAIGRSWSRWPNFGLLLAAVARLGYAMNKRQDDE